ncbi:MULTISPECIES: FAD-dependent monooxygenase [Chelativorans]|uniref:Monooxygenase, FAD-binding protein n=1 Tax=Chelativorans sp. (strain BNC1) TaxID=266779 RepID=Q11JB2_CHESB
MIQKAADDRKVLVAGAGIAGLTAALAFAAKGFSVVVFERAEKLEEVGAGLQLSPNATRILHSLGVLDDLERYAVRPEAILLKDAANLSIQAKVPLGSAAEMRWRAPYLVIHRADLQRVLVERVQQIPEVTLRTGAELRDAHFRPGGVTALVQEQERQHEVEGDLLVGADGVWSGLRQLTGGKPSNFTGYVAYRAVISHPIKAVLAPNAVTAFLSPDFHLISYPLRGGAVTNLVLVARGEEVGRGWANAADTDHLLGKTVKAAPALSALIREAGAWTAWPIHEVQSESRWIDPRGLALIGDAAHALSPYAAQGAAMAIEDAATLAALVAGGNQPAALAAFEHRRKRRMLRVARRGEFNRFVWHAGGLIARARNLVLRLKSESSLAADLDWLYGYDALRQQ